MTLASLCNFGSLKDVTTLQQPRSVGYSSGVVAATNPVYGDVVLVEYIQPFNEGDITYFVPLHWQAVATFGLYPINVTVCGL